MRIVMESNNMVMKINDIGTRKLKTSRRLFSLQKGENLCYFLSFESNLEILILKFFEVVHNSVCCL